MKRFMLVSVSILVLLCACSAPSRPKPPVISAFNARPTTMQSGGNGLLSWSVTGATRVTIDNGIGNVSVNGTRAISPASSTLYVLTASNSAGSTTATTQVIVSGPDVPSTPAGSGLPVINSYTASPTFIREGESSTLSWNVTGATEVSIDGIAVNPVGSRVVTPSGYTQYRLQATNSTGMVSRMVQVEVAEQTAPITAFDFTANAASALWYTGSVNLPFPGSDTDSRGYALVRNNATLEDNNVYPQVLVTHPQWVTDGTIAGSYDYIFDSFEVRRGDRFYSKMGFIKGASAGNVKFSVVIHPEFSGRVTLAEISKVYNGSLVTIDIPLSDFVGQKAGFYLFVKANNPNATQAWAAWVDPQILR